MQNKIDLSKKEKMEKSKKHFCILALDPSLTAFGWAVIQNNTVIDCGCIKTIPTDKKLRVRKGDDRTRRATEINTKLIEIIEKYDIELIVSELPHGSQSASAAMALGMVTGQVQGIADALKISIEWYSEADSKKNIFGKASCEKQEMVKKIKTLYQIDLPGCRYKDEAVADSIAVYHVAKNHSPIIRFHYKL